MPKNKIIFELKPVTKKIIVRKYLSMNSNRPAIRILFKSEMSARKYIQKNKSQNLIIERS